MSDRVDLLFIFLGAILGGFVTAAIVANIDHYFAKLFNKQRRDRRADVGICVMVVLFIIAIALVFVGAPIQALIRSGANVIGAFLFVKFAGKQKSGNPLA